MKISKELKDFISTYSEDINENNFSKIYSKLLSESAFTSNNNIYSYDIGIFTQLLYNVGIDPLIYMKDIPPLFLYGNEITNIKIPSNILKIQRQAFAHSKLQKVKIPDNVEIIENGIFTSCLDLNQINFGAGIREIGSNIIAYKPNPYDLKIYYNGTMDQWRKIDINPDNRILNVLGARCIDGRVIYKNKKWIKI